MTVNDENFHLEKILKDIYSSSLEEVLKWDGYEPGPTGEEIVEALRRTFRAGFEEGYAHPRGHIVCQNSIKWLDEYNTGLKVLT